MRALPFILASSLALSACSRDSAPKSEEKGALRSVSATQLVANVRALHARATLVNAWATWCGSCEHEMPMLQGLADKLAAREVQIVLVSVDEPDDRAKAQAFLTDNAIRLTSYLAERPLDRFKMGLNPRWPGMLPASFLFDAEGKLRYFWGGEAFESELLPVIEGLLAGKPIDGEARFGVAPEATAPR